MKTSFFFKLFTLVLINAKKEIKVDGFYRKTVGVAKTFHYSTNLIKKIYTKNQKCLIFLECYILNKSESCLNKYLIKNFNVEICINKKFFSA